MVTDTLSSLSLEHSPITDPITEETPIQKVIVAAKIAFASSKQAMFHEIQPLLVVEGELFREIALA